MKALNEGLFESFFTKQEAELELAVNSLFDEIFKEAFEQNGDLLDQSTFEEIIDEKLQDDAQLREILADKFGLIQLDAESRATP